MKGLLKILWHKYFTYEKFFYVKYNDNRCSRLMPYQEAKELAQIFRGTVHYKGDNNEKVY